jgi:hypothetical protein
VKFKDEETTSRMFVCSRGCCNPQEKSSKDHDQPRLRNSSSSILGDFRKEIKSRKNHNVLTLDLTPSKLLIS